MATRRTAKIARAIREAVSSTILFGLKDPRVKNVTVLNVDVSDDVRSAKVYVSVLGEPRVQALSMHGLESSRGYLQSKVADRIKTKWTPILKFVLDDGVQRSLETARLLKELEDAGEIPRLPTDDNDDSVDGDDSAESESLETDAAEEAATEETAIEETVTEETAEEEQE